MDKTNTGLIEYAKAQLGKPYWFGTFGQVANGKLWSEKAKQYPKYYSDRRKQIMKDRKDEGQKVHDCAGLWKGYMMSPAPSMPAIYDSKYDYTADSLYSKACQLGLEHGEISTIPEIPGLGLFKKGHFGVYLGNGREIEARGFDYGVLEDGLKNTKFTNWFKIPFIKYNDVIIPEPVPGENTGITEKVSNTKMPTIRQGSSGKAVMIWQVIIGAEVDGKFGPKTLNLTRTFQASHGLEVDGIVGPNSWKAGLESVG